MLWQAAGALLCFTLQTGDAQSVARFVCIEHKIGAITLGSEQK